jgi:hypothetical protein
VSESVARPGEADAARLLSAKRGMMGRTAAKHAVDVVYPVIAEAVRRQTLQQAADAISAQVERVRKIFNVASSYDRGFLEAWEDAESTVLGLVGRSEETP